MNNFDYILDIEYVNRTMKVRKTFQASNKEKADKDALKWMHICLDICGRDGDGLFYKAAGLTYVEHLKTLFK